MNDNERSLEVSEHGFHLATIHYQIDPPRTFSIKIDVNPAYPYEIEDSELFKDVMTLVERNQETIHYKTV